MWRWIGRGLVTVLAVIGLLTVVLVGGLAWQLGQLFEPPAVTVPQPIVLRLDLRQPLDVGQPGGALATPFEPRPLTVREVVEAIDRARDDDRVAALRAELGGDLFGLAEAQEIRAAVRRFREAGKPAYAYAASYGEFANGTASYYLASAFDEIWLRPEGSVGATGIYIESPFVNELLTDVGIEPEFVREGQYKTFPETFTETGLTGPHREMLESIADSLFSQIVAGIAEGRGMPEAEVVALIDRAPLLAGPALEAGLVDRLGGSRELTDEIRDRFGETAGELDVRPYLRTAGAPAGEARVALIYGVGTIVMEDGEDIPLLGQRLMGAQRVAGAIDDAVRDETIEAVVLRVDSGGGSAVASAVIGDAVRRAAEAGKPTVVSMGSAAGSGGYWISVPAQAIVAHPATLTGSIGVFAGTFGSRELWQDIGVSWGSVQRGEHAELASNVIGLSEDGREQVEAFVDSLYAQFVALVAEGRGMAPDEVREVAQGRVWTGAQALELGLVDRLGGLDEAFAMVREALGLPAGTPLEAVILPEQPSPLEQLRDLVAGGAGAGDMALAAALRRVDPAVRELLVAAQTRGDRLLVMPRLVVRP